MSRSSGRNTGSRKVRSRLKTFAMKIPSGLVIASTRRKKTAIWSHPFNVISKLLRTQKRVQEINAGCDAHDKHDQRFEGHVLLCLTSPSRKISHRLSTVRRRLSSLLPK